MNQPKPTRADLARWLCAASRFWSERAYWASTRGYEKQLIIANQFSWDCASAGLSMLYVLRDEAARHAAGEGE